MPQYYNQFYNDIPYCYECEDYMTLSSSSGAGRGYNCLHKAAYRASEETYKKLAEKEKQPTKEQMFLINKRNHEIQMSWKKKYQGKIYAQI